MFICFSSSKLYKKSPLNFPKVRKGHPLLLTLPAIIPKILLWIFTLTNLSMRYICIQFTYISGDSLKFIWRWKSEYLYETSSLPLRGLNYLVSFSVFTVKPGGEGWRYRLCYLIWRATKSFDWGSDRKYLHTHASFWALSHLNVVSMNVASIFSKQTIDVRMKTTQKKTG